MDLYQNFASTTDGYHGDPCFDHCIAEDAPDYGQPHVPESAPASAPSNTPETRPNAPEPAPKTIPAASPSSPDVIALGSDMRLLRVAMALVEGTQESAEDRTANVQRLRATVRRAKGVDEVDVEALNKGDSGNRDVMAARLKVLARTADRDLAEQLHLLVQFDKAELYKADGCSSMYIWADRYLGLARTACFERLRVGRALIDLPIIESLFALGKLSFSQLQEITRFATAATDAEFAIAVLDLSHEATAQPVASTGSGLCRTRL